MSIEDRMYEALSELAGIDTYDVSLRDSPAAYEVLGRLLSRPAWRSIETAPRDKSLILLGYLPHKRLKDGRRVYEGRWNDLLTTWTSANGFLVHDEATHWMPLPEGPQP